MGHGQRVCAGQRPQAAPGGLHVVPARPHACVLRFTSGAAISRQILQWHGCGWCDRAVPGAASQDVFGDADKLVVVVPTGDVLLKQTWEKVIKPDGHYNGAGGLGGHRVARSRWGQWAARPPARVAQRGDGSTVRDAHSSSGRRGRVACPGVGGLSRAPASSRCCCGLPSCCAGRKVRDGDVIELRTGGTGFSARDGDKVVAEK